MSETPLTEHVIDALKANGSEDVRTRDVVRFVRARGAVGPDWYGANRVYSSLNGLRQRGAVTRLGYGRWRLNADDDRQSLRERIADLEQRLSVLRAELARMEDGDA